MTAYGIYPEYIEQEDVRCQACGGTATWENVLGRGVRCCDGCREAEDDCQCEEDA